MGNKTQLGGGVEKIISDALGKLVSTVGESRTSELKVETNFEKTVDDMLDKDKQLRKKLEKPIKLSIDAKKIFDNKAVEDRINKLKKDIGEASDIINNGGQLTPKNGPLSIQNYFKNYNELKYYFEEYFKDMGLKMDSAYEEAYNKIFGSIRSGSAQYIKSDNYSDNSVETNKLAKLITPDSGYGFEGIQRGKDFIEDVIRDMNKEFEATTKAASLEEITEQLNSIEQKTKDVTEAVKKMFVEELSGDESSDFLKERIETLQDYLNKINELSDELNALPIDKRNKLYGRKEEITRQLTTGRGMSDNLKDSANDMLEKNRKEQEAAAEKIRQDQESIEQLIRDSDVFKEKKIDRSTLLDWIDQFKEDIAYAGLSLREAYQKFLKDSEAMIKENEEKEANIGRYDAMVSFIKELVGGDIDKIRDYLGKYSDQLRQIQKGELKEIEELKQEIKDDYNRSTMSDGEYGAGIDDDFMGGESEGERTKKSIQRQEETWEEIENTFETISQIRERIRGKYEHKVFTADGDLKYGYIDEYGDSRIKSLSNTLDYLKEEKRLTEDKLSEDLIYGKEFGDYARNYNQAIKEDDLDALMTYGNEIEKAQEKLLELDDEIDYVQRELTKAAQNFKPGEQWGENEINVLITLIQNLVQEIQNLSKAFGQIDDESGIPNLLTQLSTMGDTINEAFNADKLEVFSKQIDEIANKLQGMYKSIGDDLKTLIPQNEGSVVAGGPREEAIRSQWVSEFNRYKNAYNEVLKNFKLISPEYDSVTRILSAVYNTKGSTEASEFDLEGNIKRFTTGITNPGKSYEERINNVRDFFVMIQDVTRDLVGNFDLSGELDETQKYLDEELANENQNEERIKYLQNVLSQIGERQKAAQELMKYILGEGGRDSTHPSLDLTGLNKRIQEAAGLAAKPKTKKAQMIEDILAKQEEENVENISDLYIRLKTIIESLQDVFKNGFGLKEVEGEQGKFTSFLEQLVTEIQNISSTLGQIDDESGIPNLITQLKEFGEQIDTIVSNLDKLYASIGTNLKKSIPENLGKFAILASQGDNVKDVVEGKITQRYDDAYSYILKNFETLGFDLPKIIDLYKQGNSKGIAQLDSSELIEKFDLETIKALPTIEERIQRIQDFIRLAQQAYAQANIPKIDNSGQIETYQEQLASLEKLKKQEETPLKNEIKKAKRSGQNDEVIKLQTQLEEIQTKYNTQIEELKGWIAELNDEQKAWENLPKFLAGRGGGKQRPTLDLNKALEQRDEAAAAVTMTEAINEMLGGRAENGEKIDLGVKLQETLNEKAFEIDLKPKDTLADTIQTMLDSKSFRINIGGIYGKSGETPADLISQMVSADSTMGNMGTQLHERVMAFNSKTGYHTNPFLYDEIDRVRTNVVDGIIQSATEEIDTMMHTHPEALFPSFSLANFNQETGKFTSDLLGFYGYNKDNKIGTQINAAQNGVAIFDAENFYNLYGELFNEENAQNTASKINAAFKEAFNRFQNSLKPMAEVFSSIDGFIIPIENMVDEWFTGDNNIAQSFKDRISEMWKNSAGNFDVATFTSDFMKYVDNLPDDYGKNFHQAFRDFIQESFAKMNISPQEIESYFGDGSEFANAFNVAYENWFNNIMKADVFLPKVYQHLTPEVMNNALGIKDFDSFISYKTMDEFRRMYSVPQSDQQTGDYSSIINAAKSAAAAKDEFSKASQKAAESAAETTKNLQDEASAFNNIKDEAGHIDTGIVNDTELKDMAEQEKLAAEGAKKLAQECVEQFGITKKSAKELTSVFKEMVTSMLEGKQVSSNMDRVEDILGTDRNLLSGYNRHMKDAPNEASEVRKWLRGKKIKILDEYIQESGDDWDRDRRSFGFNVFQKEGMDLIEAVREMQEVGIAQGINIDHSNADVYAQLVELFQKAEKPAARLNDLMFSLASIDLRDLNTQVEDIVKTINSGADISNLKFDFKYLGKSLKSPLDKIQVGDFTPDLYKTFGINDKKTQKQIDAYLSPVIDALKIDSDFTDKHWSNISKVMEIGARNIAKAKGYDYDSLSTDDKNEIGFRDAYKAVDDLVRRVQDAVKEANKQMSELSNDVRDKNTFALDIQKLEGYSSASTDFINNIIAAVVNGEKEYDAAMQEFKDHIIQRQEEIRQEQEKGAGSTPNSSTPTLTDQTTKFSKRSEDIFKEFGMTQQDVLVDFQGLMNDVYSGSIDVDEALKRLRDTLTELKKAKEDAANTPDGSKEDAEENREAAQAAGEYTEELKKQTKEMRERSEAQREKAYGEGGVYTNQRDFRDPKNDYYYTERTGRQQFQKVHVTHQKDADGNLIYDENGETIEIETRTTITNFKALEEEVIRVDKQIIKLQNDLSNALAKGMSTDGIQTQLKLLQSESKALVTELYSYYQDNNYMPDNPQVQDFESRRLNAMTMEYGKVLQKSDVEAFNSQKRLNSEIERTDALIEQLKGKLERMKKIYQDNVNINFTSEADDKYKKAEEAIKRLQGKVSPKVEKVQAQNAIDEYVRELKQQAKNQKVSTQFDPYSIDAATEKLKTNVNMLDREMEKAKFDTDDLETKLDKLKEALKTTFTAEGIKQLNNEFRSLREQFKDRKDKFDMSGQAEKTQKDYRLAIDALQDYKRITNEINKITIKELTNGQKDVDIERKNELLQQQAKAAETARNAMIRLNEMRNNGDITDSQIRSAGKLYREGKEGTMISQTSIANAQVKANRKELENFEGILQEYEDAVSKVAQLEGQLKMSSGDNLAITTELEEARKKADEAASALENVKNVLSKDYVTDDYKNAAEYRMLLAEQERKSPEKSAAYSKGEYQGIIATLKEATKARDEYNKVLIEEAKGGIVPEQQRSSIVAELERTSEAADKAKERLEQLYYTEKKITEEQFVVGEKGFVESREGSDKTKNNLQKQLLIKQKKDVDKAIKDIDKYYEALKKASEMQDKFYEGKATSRELNKATEKAEGLKQAALEGRRTVSRAYTPGSQVIDIDKMREIRKIFSEISEKEQSLNNTDLSSFENLLKNVERYTQIKQKEKDGTPFTYNDIKFLKETEEGYVALIQKVLDYRKAVENGDDLSVFQDELDIIKKFGEAWDNARAKAVDISVDQMEQQINKLRELDLNNMGQESLTQIIDKFATLKQTIEATGQTSAETENVMKDMQRLFNSFNSDQKGGFYTQADEVSVERLRRRMSDWMSNNTVAVGATQQIKNLQKSLDGISVGGLKDVEAEFERIKERAAAAGQTGKSFGDALKKSFSGLARYMATYVSFYRIIGTMRQAINIVKELDKGLTEVRKVTSESLSDLKDWQMGIFDSAEKVGTTAQQIQESTASWLRLGKTFEEANEAAQASSWLLNVSEFENINDATTALVSITQAFKDLSFEDVIDKLNAVGDSYSSATDQLASGLQNSAAVLKVQGNDINKSLALLTAGKSLPENVETYFKNIFNCVERLKTYTTIMKKLHYESLKTYVQCG